MTKPSVTELAAVTAVGIALAVKKTGVAESGYAQLSK